MTRKYNILLVYFKFSRRDAPDACAMRKNVTFNRVRVRVCACAMNNRREACVKQNCIIMLPQ